MNNVLDNQVHRFAYDISGLNDLKRFASGRTPESIKQVAKAFEGIFVQMMMSSMRQAIPEGGLLSSSASQLFTSIFDQQIAQRASLGRGVGLADMLIKQMMPEALPTPHKNGENLPAKSATPRDAFQYLNLVTDEAKAHSSSPDNGLFSDSSYHVPPKALGQIFYQKLQPKKAAYLDDGVLPSVAELMEPATESMVNFVKFWLTPAKTTSIKSGIPYEVIIAQAALESGWGQKQIKTEDGLPSYNYFGIKAGESWQGKRTTIKTSEYNDNKVTKMVEQFRVYDNHHEALKDYIQLLTKNKRYQSVVRAPTAEHAAMALQQVNYATDPNYAAKLIQLIHRIKQINKTLVPTAKLIEFTRVLSP